ncbi:FeoB-associated Cys-rich membrane protein [Photobacterium sp. OFAV2-7]|uniref:FeoB-associated Cys-rich membrane protein n=1 Tax=Photobacterium sp. OFAV2-7 TaxID=2917748 RepID=UPI001EF6C519|nr:FeoB-associated Cys-rich membrane protein [Photobacterium sp. OFAV2-7]MCG7585121.1 FeoB-associated Cys-rich membrane protein [Photobacterium sp. OFAV2-7]
MTTNTAPTTPVLPDLAASSGWTDLAIVGLVIIAALFYLYIRLWKNKGRCDGCNRCGKPARQPQCRQIGTIATIRPMNENSEKNNSSSVP